MASLKSSTSWLSWHFVSSSARTWRNRKEHPTSMMGGWGTWRTAFASRTAAKVLLIWFLISVALSMMMTRMMTVTMMMVTMMMVTTRLMMMVLLIWFLILVDSQPVNPLLVVVLRLGDRVQLDKDQREKKTQQSIR